MGWIPYGYRLHIGLHWCSPLKQCVEGDRVSSGSSFQLMGLPSFSLSIAIPKVQPKAKGEVAQTKGASFCLFRFFGTSIRTMPFTYYLGFFGPWIVMNLTLATRYHLGYVLLSCHLPYRTYRILSLKESHTPNPYLWSQMSQWCGDSIGLTDKKNMVSWPGQVLAPQELGEC